MSDRYPRGSLQRRSAGEVEVRRPGALERQTVAVYDTVTEGMLGWEFVRTRRWVTYILVAVLFAVACVLLSRWQFDRGKQAEAYNARVEANFSSAPVALQSVLPALGSYDAADDWKRVSVTGSYDAADQLLVRTRPCGDDIGFEVLTPLRLSDGSRLIVDRGCVAASDRDPNLPAHDPAPATGEVSAVVRIEPSEARRGGTPSIKNQIESIDLQQVKSRIGGRVYTGAYGLLDTQAPKPAGSALKKVVTSAPTVGTAVHWSYMVQWVLFAGIAAWFLCYGLRTEFRRLNANTAEQRERVRKERRKAARKSFTDAEIEDEILDGFIPLSRWGLEGGVAIAPPGAGPRALGHTPALDGGAAADAPTPPRRVGPEVIVLSPAADQNDADDADDSPSEGDDGSGPPEGDAA